MRCPRCVDHIPRGFDRPDAFNADALDITGNFGSDQTVTWQLNRAQLCGNTMLYPLLRRKRVAALCSDLY